MHGPVGRDLAPIMPLAHVAQKLYSTVRDVPSAHQCHLFGLDQMMVLEIRKMPL